jgi:hypothetical protein
VSEFCFNYEGCVNQFATGGIALQHNLARGGPFARENPNSLGASNDAFGRASRRHGESECFLESRKTRSTSDEAPNACDKFDERVSNQQSFPSERASSE